MKIEQWHAALAANLGIDGSRFQLSHSSTPMLASDVELWDHLDAVPPAALVFNRSGHQFTRFSTQHDVIVNQLGFDAEAAFQGILGEETYRSWSSYLAGLTVRPTLTQLPSIFLNWAMLRSPGVAPSGASALARRALARVTQNARTPGEFVGSHRDLQQKLQLSRAVKFALHLDDGTAVDFEFGALTLWTSQPGRWYNGTALRSAYEHPKSPLWGTAPETTWDAFFGPAGKLPRAIESMVVVDGITATVHPAGITEPPTNASAGLWPFFIPDNRAAGNHIEFTPSSGTEFRLVTKIGNPVVIGNIVVGISQYISEKQ